MFCIYGAGGHKRGAHGHYKAWNTLTCIKGRCHICCCKGVSENYFILDNPCMFLMLEPVTGM
ncbi:WxcM-like domain-containing protein [Dyadobacter sp. CY312]|uniref:WxcM-like domain-containing protein n=1 Tax=Dyadobacter sp. CY312 TaxID=2907303 RepID=UPI0038D4C7B5